MYGNICGIVAPLPMKSAKIQFQKGQGSSSSSSFDLLIPPKLGLEGNVGCSEVPSRQLEIERCEPLSPL